MAVANETASEARDEDRTLRSSQLTGYNYDATIIFR
jgi:hypothetical protein